MGLQFTDKYHENILEEALNVNCTTIMQDVDVITDRTILANLPDIILHDKKKKKRRLAYWSM